MVRQPGNDAAMKEAVRLQEIVVLGERHHDIAGFRALDPGADSVGIAGGVGDPFDQFVERMVRGCLTSVMLGPRRGFGNRDCSDIEP